MSRRRPRKNSLRTVRAGPTDRGSASIQMVMLMPVLFTVMFLGLQAALYYWASTVAGAAAQALSAYPDALPGELQDFLQSRAIDQGPVGADPQFGFGRLYLADPPDIWDYPYHLFVPAVVQNP